MTEYEICRLTTDAEMDEKGFVHWKSWHETYAGLMPAEYLRNVTLEKCVKMAHKFPQNTLLLKVDNRVVGFSCFGTSADDAKANEVIALYLLAEFHGKQLGYALLKHTVALFGNRRPIILWVLKGNDRAIRFYQRFGFEYTGKEKACPFGVELQMVLTSQNQA